MVALRLISWSYFAPPSAIHTVALVTGENGFLTDEARTRLGIPVFLLTPTLSFH